MPILKMEGRLWHLARKLNKPEAWSDNVDLRLFPEVKRQRKKMDMLTISAWMAGDVLVFGYRPYGLFVCVSGALVIGNAISWIVLRLISTGGAFWFWFFTITLVAGIAMVYYGLFSKSRRFIAFDRQRGLVHFSRPILGRYISTPWQDAHFMKIRWHIPRGWRPGKTDLDLFYFLPPPFRSPASPLLSYAFRKQVIAPGCSPDKIWWLAVHFMCYGPAHHKNMAKMLDERKEDCDACFGGDMATMQYYVGRKVKVYPGIGSTELHFDYGKDWKHLDMSKLPTAPSHVIGLDGKWKKLKKHERGAYIPGPAWESLTSEQAEALFEEPHRKRKAERRAS